MPHAKRLKWFPPVVWAAFIGLLTSVPLPKELGDLPKYSDKVAHAAMYAVVGLLVARALEEGRSRQATIVLAVGLCAAWGAMDEWHQLWIPGRTADIADWYADLAGAAIGALVWTLYPLFAPSRPV